MRKRKQGPRRVKFLDLWITIARQAWKSKDDIFIRQKLTDPAVRWRLSELTQS